MLDEMRARALIEQAVATVQPPLLLDAFDLAKRLSEPVTPFEPSVLLRALPCHVVAAVSSISWSGVIAQLLDTAEGHRLGSIAIPALGTGVVFCWMLSDNAVF